MLCAALQSKRSIIIADGYLPRIPRRHAKYLFLTVLALLAGNANAVDSRQPIFFERDIYGWQIMSAQEREDFRDLVINAKDDQERHEIQLQHEQDIQQRVIDMRRQSPQSSTGGASSID